MKKGSTLLLLFLSFSCYGQQVTPAFEWLSRFYNVRDFSTRHNEAYFSIQSPNEDFASIIFVKKIKNKWSKPELLSFSGQYRDIEPFLSPDGLRLYFSSNRPLNEADSIVKDYDIWYAERKSLSAEWSKPKNIGEPVNTIHNEFYPSVTDNQNIYFTSDGPQSMGKDDIFFSKWSGEKYDNPIPLDSNINSTGYEFNAFVAPNEDFIIYTIYGRKDGLGSGDLYISTKGKDGRWAKANTLGSDINSGQMDYCPFVDLQSNTLYFTSKRNNIVAKKHVTIKDYEKTINQYENGQSRIYKVSIGDIINLSR